MPELILASTSRYRRELLERLGLPFRAERPVCDETPLTGETAAETATRLARWKAESLRERFPGALIIGSDQVALLDGQQLGKPGNFDRAQAQLRAMRGKTIVFHTALCLHDATRSENQEAVVPWTVTMRDYSDDEIVRYLEREQPYDCAGSAKTEGLGASLIADMQGSDPAALIGLPLIALCAMLRRAGVAVP